MLTALRRRPRTHHFHSSNRNGEGVALSFIGSALMLDKLIYEPKELAYLEYEQWLTSEYEQLLAAQAAEPLISIDRARNIGVEREWELYSFFAREEVNAPEDIFIYVDDTGNIATFTEEERALIAVWERGDPYPLPHIEGHHMQLVSHNLDNLELAADPDNILLATSSAHLEHLHDGHYHNLTPEIYFELNMTHDERLERTLAYAHDNMTVSLREQLIYTGGVSSALFVTIGLIAEYYKLSQGPRPWKQKEKILLQKGISYAVMGSLLGGVGFVTREILNTAFDQLPDDLADAVFMEILALNSSFLAVTLTSACIKYLRDIRNGKTKADAQAELKRLAMVAAAEFIAFQALGIGFDFVSGMFAEALMPDPTGFFIVARAIYFVYRIFNNRELEKRSAVQCRELRINHLYQQANLYLEQKAYS
ncbi:hypothetical protein CathTA2_0749 [Caldalkalibacillus thermarum TA2.A1]|uniref:Uncharacterized protein n=1 Tax=Caldalkalibacillus thermarum (strain TA2.A1) TaxID=986075 RepID=F5L4N6_CALTT|nr:hypothetical protein [Caldalkalibacillus thermarum]EGL83702.1 hypothetical protein CathTA2_0749 [Caldalkalibacillus thermarum TA2.A1]